MHCAASSVFDSFGLQKTKNYSPMVITSHGSHYISSMEGANPSASPSSDPAVLNSRILKPCHHAPSSASPLGTNPSPPSRTTSSELDPRLWHACAGSVMELPSVGSKVIYFPNGHAEACYGGPSAMSADRQFAFSCRVTRVDHLADELTDEVYAKVSLLPDPKQADALNPNLRHDFGERVSSRNEYSLDRLLCFAKTLTQSDANNGGGFSVPRYCAETIFPSLDYSLDPPFQTLVAKDVHGKLWKFRHIYRGTPRRHLLTTGWSTFVNAKKLSAGDTVVFLRSANDELCVGIRRSQTDFDRRANDQRSGSHSHSTSTKADSKSNSRKSMASMLRRKTIITSDDVSLSFELARKGREFEIILFPRANLADYCVDSKKVFESLSPKWAPGTRCRLAHETDDVSHPGWLNGTVQDVDLVDLSLWPCSAWRSLSVAWDDADRCAPERVSPWQVELILEDPSSEVIPSVVVETSKRQRTASAFGQDSTGVALKITHSISQSQSQSLRSTSLSPTHSPSNSSSIPYQELPSPSSPTTYHCHLMPVAGLSSDRKRSSPSSSLVSNMESSVTNHKMDGCARNPSEVFADILSNLSSHPPGSFPKYAWPVPLSSASHTLTGSFSPGGRSVSSTNTRSEESLTLALSCQTEDRTDGSGSSRQSDHLSENRTISGKVDGSGQSMMLFGHVIESNPNTGVFKGLHVSVPRTDSWQDTAISPASLLSPFSPSFPFQNCYTPSNSYDLNGLMEKNLILDLNAMKRSDGNIVLDEREREKDKKDDQFRMKLSNSGDKLTEFLTMDGEVTGASNLSSAYVCKVFFENESVGRSIDLSKCRSHEELAYHLASIFNMNPRDIIDRLVFHDPNSEWLLASSIPFEKFMLTAKRAMILSLPLSHKQFP